MITFFLLSLPIFGVVGVGWAATRARLVGVEALDALGAFSFRFGLPALVLGLIARQPVGRFSPVFYAGYLACGGLVFAAVLGLSLLAGRLPLAAASARATTATVSNIGFLGLPLLLAFFGDRAAGPLAMAILAEVMVLFSVGGALMAASGRDGTGTGVARLVLRGTVLNPIVAAIAVGAVLAGAGLSLPGPVDRFLAFLGGAAGPTALFALGGALAVHRLDRATLLAAAATAAVKLLCYPVVVWCVLAKVLALDPLWVQAGVLIAALPSAGNTYVMAQRHAADPEHVSTAIALSTLASVLTVPLAGWLVMR